MDEETIQRKMEESRNVFAEPYLKDLEEQIGSSMNNPMIKDLVETLKGVMRDYFDLGFLIGIGIKEE